MAYLVTKMTLEETIKMSERLQQRAFKHVIDMVTEKIADNKEIEARQKYRDYQYSLTSYLKELKQKS